MMQNIKVCGGPQHLSLSVHSQANQLLRCDVRHIGFAAIDGLDPVFVHVYANNAKARLGE